MTKNIKQKGIKEFDEKLPKVSSPSTFKSDTINTVVSIFNKYTDKIRTNKNIELSGSAVLKLPDVTTLSATCSIGQMTVSSGKLYICSAVDTWTVVGTQV